MKKIWFVLALVVVIAVGVILWRSDNNLSRSKVVKVGISQLINHAILTEFRQGMSDAFVASGYIEGKNIVFDDNNAQGDMSVNQSIAQKLASSDNDLFIAITTPSAQALAKLITNKPIIFGAITDPIAAGLVKSWEKPGGNLTGTSDAAPYKAQLELFNQLVPTAKKIGIVYNPGETAATAGLAEAKKYNQALGLEFVMAPVSSSSEVLSAARSLVDKVDAFYILPDNTVIAGQDALIKVALEAKKPVIADEQSGVEKGALATRSGNYYKLGQQTAELAINVIRGAKPANLPVLGALDADLMINTKTAATIGITIPADLLKSAKQVYDK